MFRVRVPLLSPIWLQFRPPLKRVESGNRQTPSGRLVPSFIELFDGFPPIRCGLNNGRSSDQIRLGGRSRKVLGTADCTIAMRCCSSSAGAFSAVLALPTYADGLYFFISAATCCDTSIEICLDLTDPPVMWGFLTCEGFLTCVGLCASGLSCRHSLNSRHCACVSFLYSWCL